MTTTTRSPVAFELKGSLFTLTVLRLLDVDLENVTAQLRQQAQNTPNLFKNMPLVLDLQAVSHHSESIDFIHLQQLFRQHGLIPVGIRHGNSEQTLAAQAAGLALLSSQGQSTAARTRSTERPASQGAAANAPTFKMITKPIRSGQQVYARHADLIVVAPVSHGAELLADGNIHVYGTLRGRALAGVMGDKSTRIFCLKLEAELVSIAGYYKLQDDLPKTEAKATQIFLCDAEIQVSGM